MVWFASSSRKSTTSLIITHFCSHFTHILIEDVSLEGTSRLRSVSTDKAVCGPSVPGGIAFAAIVANRHLSRWSGIIKMATSATYQKKIWKGWWKALACNGSLLVSQHLNSSLFDKNPLCLNPPAFTSKHKLVSLLALYVLLCFCIHKKVLINFRTVCQHNLSVEVSLIYFSCDLFSCTNPKMVYL